MPTPESIPLLATIADLRKENAILQTLCEVKEKDFMVARNLAMSLLLHAGGTVTLTEGDLDLYDPDKHKLIVVRNPQTFTLTFVVGEPECQTMTLTAGCSPARPAGEAGL